MQFIIFRLGSEYFATETEKIQNISKINASWDIWYIIIIHKFKSFKELCENIDCNKCGFDTNEKLLSVLEEFYPIEKQLEFGVIGIEIERI